MSQGPFSPFRTDCCGVPICDYETNCPACRKLVIGCEIIDRDKRHEVRWKNATRLWKR